MWKVFVLGAFFLYEFIGLPHIIRANIYRQVKSMGGELISMQSVSRRDALYLVEYKVEGKYLKNTVKCNVLGYIVAWL